MHLHKYALMRSTLDFPDPLFRHLKARAALEGTTLRELILRLLERGMAASSVPANDGTASADAALAVPQPPSIRLGAPLALPAAAFSNAGLIDYLDE